MTTVQFPTTLDWHGCYGDKWKGEIDDAAFRHPAKFSRKLIGRIYQWLIENDLLRTGDSVLDPFGGVALGGLDAARAGLLWTGIELEIDFVILAMRNIATWAEREWCCCESETYLHSMREFIREGKRGSEQKQETEVRPVLQQGVQQSLPLYWENIDSRTSPEAKETSSLEQRKAAHQGDQRENIKEGQEKNRKQESKLAGRETAETGWIYRDTGQQPSQTRTHSYRRTGDGYISEKGRNRTSYQRAQNGQPIGKSKGDDNIRTHETTSPEGDQVLKAKKNLRDLSKRISGETQSNTLQHLLQTSQAARILAKTRRQAEGKYCEECNKLIVPFPVIMQGDSRQLLEVLAQVRAQGVVSSPPYAGSNQNYEAGWKYIDKDKLPHNRYSKNREASYGTSEGQLAEMPPGDVDAVVSSPPWGTTEGAKAAHKFRDPEQSAQIQEDTHRQPHMNFASKEALLRAMEKANGETYGDTPGNLGNMPAKESEWDAVVSSPPYGHNHKHDYRDRENDRNQGRGCWRGVYGRTDGQLTNMGEGDIEAVVSSPPFVESLASDDPDKRGGLFTKDPKRRNDRTLTATYGNTEGQLGAMKAGDAQAVVTSPPYENSVNQSDSASDFEARKRRMQQAGVDTTAAANIGGSNSVYQQPQHYSHDENNLGTQNGDTFWSAARLIVEQCHAALADGGVAVWVCKDFVRNKKRVPFSQQWAQICISAGFEPVAHVRAWLVEDRGAQWGIDGELVRRKVERKSFFRKLAEAKGSPRIDWEDVLVFRKRDAT